MLGWPLSRLAEAVAALQGGRRRAPSPLLMRTEGGYLRVIARHGGMASIRSGDGKFLWWSEVVVVLGVLGYLITVTL